LALGSFIEEYANKVQVQIFMPTYTHTTDVILTYLVMPKNMAYIYLPFSNEKGHAKALLELLFRNSKHHVR
jgi:hypothetical protein